MYTPVTDYRLVGHACVAHGTSAIR